MSPHLDDPNWPLEEFPPQFFASDDETALECHEVANVKVVKFLAVQFAYSGEDSTERVDLSQTKPLPLLSYALRLMHLCITECPCLCNLSEARQKLCTFLHPS